MRKEHILSNVNVANIRSLHIKEPAVISADQLIHEVLETGIADTRTRNIYVVDEDRKLIGVVRIKKILEYLFPLTTITAQSSLDNLSNLIPSVSVKTARDLMLPNPYYVEEETPLNKAAQVLLRENILELPVVDSERRIIGQLDASEIVACYLNTEKQSA